RRRGYRLVEQRNREVRDADVARQAAALGVTQRPHSLRNPHRWIGPMNECQVEDVDFKALKAFLERALQVAIADHLRTHLGRDPDFRALDPGGAQAFANFRLVAVTLCGVDMAEANA